VFSLCSTVDEQTEFSCVFNFAILSYSRNSQKFHEHENNMVYIIFIYTAVCKTEIKLKQN